MTFESEFNEALNSNRKLKLSLVRFNKEAISKKQCGVIMISFLICIKQ